MHCKYRLYLEDEDTVTERISLTSNPDFNHTRLVKFNPVTKQVRLFNFQLSNVLV